jgi:HSP20 family molecular chaperone IbpA
MKTDKDLQKSENRVSRETTELTHDRPVFVPATDIYENERSIFVVCDMPGVGDKGVDISLENNVLEITGHQTAESFDGYELLHRGYANGIYQRAFTISDAIDREKISAKIKNGVLHLELPKAEEAKPRKIKVKVEE